MWAALCGLMGLRSRVGTRVGIKMAAQVILEEVVSLFIAPPCSACF